MKKQTLATFLLLTLFGFRYQDNKLVTTNNDFHLPIVIQQPTKDTLEYFKADYLPEVWFLFYGKYKFTDTLQLPEHLKMAYTYKGDFFSEYFAPAKDDTLTTDGFQIFTDYPTTIYQKEDYTMMGNYFFPVYVVNETSRTKVFIGKSSGVLGLQEAIDESSPYTRWRPIEGRGGDDCGNGYFGLKVHPGEFVMFLVPKYEGEEKGYMRLRLMVGESIYLSQSYVGTFNRKQFNVKVDDYFYDKLKDDKASAIQWLFYGARPKGYDSHK